MPCTSPLTGYVSAGGGMQFHRKGSDGRRMMVACGQCMDCRIDRARAWSIRCLHESQKYLENSFITLTYAPEHLPPGGTLVKKHFQDFIKRLRKSIGDRKISFFHCGEYGENLSRPHYHALLFGYDFQDKLPWKKSHDGSQIYTSKILEKLWGKGHATTGAVTITSANYCAGYILKKINGERAKDHYQGKQPEYITMSTRPAIGLDHIKKYRDEIYHSDTLVVRGKETRPPRFYDKQLRKGDPEKYDEIKKNRKTSRYTQQSIKNSSLPRRKARAEITKSRVNQFKRELS